MPEGVGYGKASPAVTARSNGVTATQARKPTADKGARSSGAPAAPEAERQREGQSTDTSQ